MTDRSNYAIGLADDGTPFMCDQPECNVHHAAYWANYADKADDAHLAEMEAYDERMTAFVAPEEYAEYASQPLTMDIDIPCGDVWCKAKASRLEVRVGTDGTVSSYFNCERHTAF